MASVRDADHSAQTSLKQPVDDDSTPHMKKKEVTFTCTEINSHMEKSPENCDQQAVEDSTLQQRVTVKNEATSSNSESKNEDHKSLHSDVIDAPTSARAEITSETEEVLTNAQTAQIEEVSLVQKLSDCNDKRGETEKHKLTTDAHTNDMPSNTHSHTTVVQVELHNVKDDCNSQANSNVDNSAIDSENVMNESVSSNTGTLNSDVIAVVEVNKSEMKPVVVISNVERIPNQNETDDSDRQVSNTENGQASLSVNSHSDFGLGDSSSLKSNSSASSEKQTVDNNRTDDSGVESEFSKSDDSNIHSDLSEVASSIDSSEHPFFLHDLTLPEYFNALVDGLKVCGDHYRSMEVKPQWFNAEKFYRGQKVAMKYFFGLQFAQMLSLLIVLGLPDGLTPLIFTGKSDTPFKAFKRYLSTALRVRSWYLDDLWDPETKGHKNLKAVRAIHENLRKRLTTADPEEIAKMSTLATRSENGCPMNSVWSPLHDKVIEDFQATIPYPKISQSMLVELHRNRAFVNQSDMAVTQFGFVGLFIMYPSYFGAHGVTDEELDSFAHLWCCIGYMLGVEDRFNFCFGDLKTVQKRTSDLIDSVVRPSLRVLSHDWEHMTRCVTEGVSYYVTGVTWEVSLLYLCNILNLYTPRLQASLSLRQRIMYYLTFFTFWVTMRIPGAQTFFNWTVRMSLKRAETASPNWLREHEEKKYPFQEKMICTHL